MRKLGWIVAGSLLAVGFASAQQVGSPATPPAAGNTETIETAPPAHPATEDQIREYLSLIRADKAAHEMMDSAVQAMQATSAPYYGASFWSDMRTEFQKVDITAVYVPIYQRYMSQAEMQAVIDFYRSPAGQKLLEAQPLATRDAKVVMRKKGAEVGAAVYARHKDEIEAAKKKYEAGTPKPEIDLGTAPK